VRPESYLEINNFYTVTIYEKGAEVVRMMQTLTGRAGFARGLALYFDRHDRQAVTCDDFRAGNCRRQPGLTIGTSISMLSSVGIRRLVRPV
jgi:aminopeptidase N